MSGPLSRHFDQLQGGEIFETVGRTITEADLVSFSALTGDWHPQHADAEWAAAGPFGERIAHGMLGLSAATGLTSRLGFIDGTAMAFLGIDWKFRRPILMGDTIHVVVNVTDKHAQRMMGGGIVTFDVRVVNQRDEIVQNGHWKILVRFKPAEAAPATTGPRVAGAPTG